MISTDPWIWISAFFSLCSFSLLYGDNPFFRLGETTYTATVIGHAVVTANTTLRSGFYYLFTDPFGSTKIVGATTYYRPNLLMVIPLILGVLSLFVLWRKYAWITTLSFAVMIGVGTGTSLRLLTTTDVLGNARAAIAEVAKVINPPDAATQLGYLLRIVLTVAAISYFLFTVAPKGGAGKSFGYLNTLGKYALIIYMGIALGNTLQQFIGTATSAIFRLTGLWLGLG
jgi:hypothetical protein